MKVVGLNEQGELGTGDITNTAVSVAPKNGETNTGTIFRKPVSGDNITAVRTAASAVYTTGAGLVSEDGLSPSTDLDYTLTNFGGIDDVWCAAKQSQLWQIAHTSGGTAGRRNRGSAVWLQQGNNVRTITDAGVKTFDSPIRLKSGNCVLLENGELWVYGSTAGTNPSWSANTNVWSLISMNAISSWNPNFVRELSYARLSVNAQANVLLWVDSRTSSVVRKAVWTASSTLPTAETSAFHPFGGDVRNLSPVVYGAGDIVTESRFWYMIDGRVWESNSFVASGGFTLPGGGEIAGGPVFDDYWIGEGLTNSPSAPTKTYGIRIIGRAASNGHLWGYGANGDGALANGADTTNRIQFGVMNGFAQPVQSVSMGQSNIVVTLP